MTLRGKSQKSESGDQHLFRTFKNSEIKAI